MSSFGRVLQLALQYRFTFLASVVCALAVGLLWGANIGAVYPFVQVAIEEESLQSALETKIGESQARAAELTAAILRTTLAQAMDPAGDRPTDRQRELAKALDEAQSSLAAENLALRGYHLLEPVVRDYLPEDAFQTMLVLIGLILAGTLLKSVFIIAHTVLVARLSQLGTFELRKLFYRRTLRMDLATFSNEGTSDLMSRFTHDMQNVAEGLNVLFGKLIREPLKMAACLIGAGCICWRLLVLSLVIVPVAALAIRWLAITLKRANRRAMEEMALLYNTLDESFRGIKIVKAFTMERHERKRFHDNSKQYYRKSMRIARYDALSHPLTEVMGIVTICLALMAGAYLVLSGETHVLGIRMCTIPLSRPGLLSFYALLAGAADPARKLSDVLTRLQRAAAASERIYDLLDREPSVREPADPRRLGRHRKNLVFDGVHFAYRPGMPVLHGIDLEIAFGETIAIVGSSGCGKSTLANLIPRFADPTGGSIRLDGVELTDVRLSDLRGQIGLVTQDPLLFDDTVLNNIRYGSPHATDGEVIRAAEQAYAHRFIERELPHGYQSQVGPMGGQLSGGQKQRIALARAILRNPAILILDEATSQIDLESEQLIQKVLQQFIRGRTAVIITHRLGALALADRIVVMEDGRILDVGRHDELTARCPFYARLHQIRFEDRKASA
jgi:ATP-binding cassette subfamily B protein/subfamily B ATP-binding cassette protein MsbA